jgi:amino acid transporter
VGSLVGAVFPGPDRAGAIWLTARGVKLSTVAVGVAVLVQVAIMVVVCILVLVDRRADLSGIPFSWGHLTGGLAGLSAGFPLALFMFIGWENGPALAEESRDPRRTIPRALFISVAIAAALLVFFAYATVTGFGPSRVHVAAPPGLVFADTPRGDSGPWVDHPDRPVRRAVPARTAAPLQRLPVHCASGRGGGRCDRVHCCAPPPAGRRG